MTLSLTKTVTAALLAVTAAGGAKADSILHYTFGSNTYYDFAGGSTNSVTGSFDFDATNDTLSNVNYNRGGEIFTTGLVGSTKELYFGDTTSSDYDVYEFARSLAGGGTITITNGYHPAIVVDVGGSVTAAGATGTVPEPASWALMLAGFGIVGSAVRSRRTTRAMTAA